MLIKKTMRNNNTPIKLSTVYCPMKSNTCENVDLTPHVGTYNTSALHFEQWYYFHESDSSISHQFNGFSFPFQSTERDKGTKIMMKMKIVSIRFYSAKIELNEVRNCQTFVVNRCIWMLLFYKQHTHKNIRKWKKEWGFCANVILINQMFISNAWWVKFYSM